MFMLRKDGLVEHIKDLSSQIKDCMKWLQEFDSRNRIEENLVLQENRAGIESVITELQNIYVVLDNHSFDENKYKQILESLCKCEQELRRIFDIEKTRFEKKYGAGTYNNKSWRGFQASYRCEFPAQYLDEIRKVFLSLHSISDSFEIEIMSDVSNHAILITGKGGIGKTHLLCDIVNDYLVRGIPAVLMVGDIFNGTDLAENVIMNWFQQEECIDAFLGWLNEYGFQNNVYIPFCIDAINEVDNVSYWNSNLPRLLAKAKMFENIKVIVSCREIYLKEYLDDEKIAEMLNISHKGFQGIEIDALARFCEYYGVNINYDTTLVPEFMNPLFIKMLCEIAAGKDEKTVVVEDIQTLMDEFLKIKNKKISNYYKEYVSVNDHIVSLSLNAVTQYMSDNDHYSISWSELRRIVATVLDDFGMKSKTSGFIKYLISENLLREADERETNIAFAYQKFYEFLHAQKYAEKEIEDIFTAIKDRKMTLGTLEMLQLIYFRNTKEELISKGDDSVHGELVDTFMSGLYWRNENEINETTITEIEKLLYSSNETDIRRVIFGLLAVATKCKCVVNAHYIHRKLSSMTPYRRDYFLSFFLLKQYDQEKILSDICERAIVLKDTFFSAESVLLWKIILCWGTGSNDIKLRDLSSKGLTNLFRLYPSDMSAIIELFENVDDDYIQERIWQAIYSALVISEKECYVQPILTYIKENLVSAGLWPQNVLIRDYLRNIYEFSYYKGWCTYEDLVNVRPIYKSKKHEPNQEFAAKYEEEYRELYWNCQSSDFAIYTIPSEVENYGLTKKDVGLMIFEDIVRSGYGPYGKYDSYIDYTFGSLRNRDEQVERIGKKYQKIYLYRELGNIFDNYKYSPRFKYTDVELVSPEQGNSLRSIDLMTPYEKNVFEGTSLKYPFFRYSKWDDLKWFKNKDSISYIPRLIKCNYMDEDYCILQGYFSSSEIGKKEFRDIWMQVRTYFYPIDKKEELLNWFVGKDFEGRWMPEGFGQLYECFIGEYPWSPTMINYLGQEYDHDFSHEEAAPCRLIPTANDYSLERESPFWTFDNSSYMFPAKELMDGMNLQWNGSFGYDANGHTVIFNGKNNTLFIKKAFLVDYLKQKGQGIIWTVLGEKQRIKSGFGGNFSGKAEFSYTYYLDEALKLVRNHEVYNVREPFHDLR